MFVYFALEMCKYVGHTTPLTLWTIEEVILHLELHVVCINQCTHAGDMRLCGPPLWVFVLHYLFDVMHLHLHCFYPWFCLGRLRVGLANSPGLPQLVCNNGAHFIKWQWYLLEAVVARVVKNCTKKEKKTKKSELPTYHCYATTRHWLEDKSSSSTAQKRCQ